MSAKDVLATRVRELPVQLRCIGTPRKVKLTNAAGDVVGESDHLELIAGLLKRQDIETELYEEQRQVMRKKNMVPTLNLVARNMTRAARHGAGNYLPQETIVAAIAMRLEGKSLRAIAAALGISRPAVERYVPRIGKSEAMRLMHQRLKEEGRSKRPPPRRGRTLPPSDGILR